MSSDPDSAFEALQLSELRQRRAIELSQSGWAVVDRSTGFLIEASPLLLEFLRCSPEQAIGKNFLRLLLPENPDEVSALEVELTRAGRAQRQRLPLLSANGLRAVDLTAQVFSESGRDITQFSLSPSLSEPISPDRGETEAALARARDEAMSASAAKDRFLASLSHELRTPLNPALLLASENATNEHFSPEVRRDFDAIRKHIELEVHLIDDILDLTRISQGKLAVNLQPVRLHPIIREAVTIIRAEVFDKQINLAVQLHAENDAVSGDAVRLQQVFWNLLRNAVKFTPAKGTISIQTQQSRDASGIEVWINDTGIGMTPEEIVRVFSAFTQGRHAATGDSHKFGGLGLGLAISRMLIELHRGRVRAQSEGPNRGATFVVELPSLPAGIFPAKISTPPVRRETGFSAATGPGGRRFRALVVEDHFGSRMALVRLLERRGYDVTAADCGSQARQCAASGKFDVFISDIGLPDTNGYELMKEFRQLYGLRGIAVTGYGMESDLARAEAAGFFAHLTKPVSITALEAALSDFHADTAGVSSK